jgi:L-arabonate dehydrase
MKPTTMPYRNPMARDVEDSIGSYTLDGAVVLTSCNETNPASIMGPARRTSPMLGFGAQSDRDEARARNHELKVSVARVVK